MLCLSDCLSPFILLVKSYRCPNVLQDFENAMHIPYRSEEVSTVPCHALFLYPFDQTHTHNPIHTHIIQPVTLSLIWVHLNSNISHPTPTTLEINLLRAVRANNTGSIRSITRREQIACRGCKAPTSTPVFVLVPVDLRSSKRPAEALTLQGLMRVAQLGHARILTSVRYGGR